jgi:uncharacterized protein YqcC (DUF446 family)
VDEQLYEWMAPTIAAVQPYCDEPVMAAATFQGAGGWASGASGGLIGALAGTVLRRTPKDVRARAGGLPDTVILAVGPTKIFVFPYRTRWMRLIVGPPVRVWRRDDVEARTDVRMVASKLTIDVASTGDHHELESTSMTGRLGKITREMFRLLANPHLGAPVVSRYELPREELEPVGRVRPPDARQARAGQLAGELEAELKRLGVWRPDAPSEETVVAGGAFGMNAVPFYTWLQVVLVARLRQIAAGEMEVPASSSIGAFAVRELDGETLDVERLLELIHEIDRLPRARA